MNHTKITKALRLTPQIWYNGQDGVRQYFLQRLMECGREFNLIDGNIVVMDLEAVPCLVAHMDTVNDKAMTSPLLLDKGILSRKNAILGADDKAGVQIIDDYFEDCNFILTRDEEVGLLGAEVIGRCEFVAGLMLDKEIPCMLEFDRMNNHHIIGPYNDYCQSELAERIEELSGGTYTVDMGVCTDLDELRHTGVEGVNLSVGYYNQHSKMETLNIGEFETARNLAGILLSGLYGESFRFEGEFPDSKVDTSWYMGHEYDMPETNCEYCDKLLIAGESFICTPCEVKEINEVNNTWSK